ncbi:MAG: rarD [Caulobacteraceae bacterium]|nr:rarD [Caulobacteraceae bacterium]
MTSASGTFRAGPGSVSEDRSALFAGIGCYVLWSGLSVLFMALAGHGVGPWEILAHRCLWSLPWATGLLWLARGGREAWAVLRTPRTLLWLGCSAVLVSLNWSVFILASTTGRKLDASLGYYINPLLNMAAGAVLFRERISRMGLLAIALATVGVALQAAAVGHPPWLALSMAVSFWAYGVIRKRVPASAQVGLFVECLMLAPLGLAYLLWLHGRGVAPLGSSPAATLLILATGPATAIPLSLFAFAARRLPLSTMGFLQFIMPTVIFGIAMATGEPLTPLRAVSFGFIWSGVAVFSVGSALAARRAAEGRPSAG